MNLGRVVGSLTSTVKHAAYHGTKIMLVQVLDAEGNMTDAPPMVCVDTVGAGVGEDVLVCKEGAAARMILGVSHAPVRSLIVGIVDQVNITR